MVSTSEELVSVFIPTHCRVDMAIRAVSSVLSQDYTRVEIIVCDDGTPYEDSLKLRSFLEQNDVVYLRNDNSMGACHARNRAISHASGTLITGLDDDDEFAAGRLGELVSTYRSKWSFLATGYLEVNSSGQHERTFDSGTVSYDQLLHYNKIGNQVITETKKIRAVNGFDERLPAMQDYDLWIRLCQAFGVARKIESCSYKLHSAHEEVRISYQIEKLTAALDILEKKYAKDLQPHHRRSHKILRKQLANEPIGFVEAVKCLHADNYKMVISKYLDQYKR